jgi:hypothetical protein
MLTAQPASTGAMEYITVSERAQRLVQHDTVTERRPSGRKWKQEETSTNEISDVVDVDLVVLAEVEPDVLLVAHRICLVDLGVLRQLAVRFH